MPKKTSPAQPLPSGAQSLDDITRRYYSQKEREAMDPEDFAGPGRSFPIKTQQDVHNAARLIGHADDPEAVKAKIIEIAKRKGFALPKQWQDEEDAKSGEKDKRTATASLTRSQSEHEGGHQDEEGEAVGVLDEEEDDEGEEDEDDSDLMDDLDGAGGENVDEPRKAETATILRTLSAQDVRYFAPITRINKAKREVIGVATAERKDAYRTVIGYEASKDAFARWPGNIREMHQSKAVGRALEVLPDDAKRCIVVRARISKGAEDTWQKVLDGTLTGFSIGGKNGKWTTRVIDGEELPYLERYDQAELSLVDNPACPGATFEVVRADGYPSDILAKDEEMKTPKSQPTPQASDRVERAGARISKETRDAMHLARDHAQAAHRQAAMTCGCDDCQSHIAALNQIGAHDDNDGDMDANYLAPASMRRLVADIVRSVVAETLREQVAPVVARVNALLAADSQRSEEAPEISRRVDGIDEQLAEIRDLVEKIAAQPADGGPILHGAPIDKRLATQQGAARSMDVPEIMRRAMELGFTPPSDPQDQVRAAAQLVRPIPR